MNSLVVNRWLVVGVILFSLSAISAQDGPQTRSITSDDFNNQRPANKNLNNKLPKTSLRRATYKFVSRNKKVVRRQSVRSKPQNIAKAEKVYDVGVTMWKLRPPRDTDQGYQLPVLVNNVRQLWTAERVDADTLFHAGDRVRLAIESSISGYLYIINSELFSDGSVGDPFLIFPETEKDDNSVQPGLLVDIPDQREDLPYFLIKNPKNSNYQGELLTVIISPDPLKSFRMGKDGKIKNLEDLIDLENNTAAEIYNRNDSLDKIYSKAEAESACGAKSRQLTREKSAQKPCGEKTRQLTREEPLPQTIYRVKAATDQPLVVLVRINVNQ
jgi:hypothetical protein